MTMRFSVGSPVQWWKPEDRAWSNGTVAAVSEEAEGYSVRDPKLPELVQVPALMVRAVPEVGEDEVNPLTDVTNVIDLETQVTLCFPHEANLEDLSAEVYLHFEDAATGDPVLDADVFLTFGKDSAGGPIVWAEIRWDSFIPGAEQTRGFQRNVMAFTQAAHLAYGLAAGVGQQLRAGASRSAAIREAHRRATLAAQEGLSQAVRHFANPTANLGPLDDVIRAIKGEPGTEARIIVLDDNHN